MNQELLYKTVVKAGCKVYEFMDNPAAFGSWYIIVIKGKKRFRIVFDGRDGRTTIEKPAENNVWIELDDKICKDETVMPIVTTWLSKVDEMLK